MKTSRRSRFSPTDEEAGAREPFEDAALYDFEYRRRRADINFYRHMANNRMECGTAGPILDLACGTGRLFIPLLRDGHTVVGLDRAPAMLTRAAARLRRLPDRRRRRGLLLRADLRAFALRPRFALAVCAFHSVQHLITDADLVRFFRSVRASLLPDGWLTFDVLPPDPTWIARDPQRRWARTVFRHPTTYDRLTYTTNHVYDDRRRTLHMRLYYQPIDDKGRVVHRERVMRLCHRQIAPAEMKQLLRRAGFRMLALFGSFDGRLVEDETRDGDRTDEHIYVARVS